MSKILKLYIKYTTTYYLLCIQHGILLRDTRFSVNIRLCGTVHCVVKIEENWRVRQTI